VPSPEDTAEGFTRQQLSKITKALFAIRIGDSDEGAARAAEDEGFEALRELAAQKHRQLCSSSCTTQGVNVRCTSVYVPQQQRCEEPINFTYRAFAQVPYDSESLQFIAEARGVHVAAAL